MGLGTFEAKHRPVESVRLNGAFCNDECACLDLNEAESADTVLRWKPKGWGLSFFPLKKHDFFYIAIKQPFGLILLLCC